MYGIERQYWHPPYHSAAVIHPAILMSISYNAYTTAPSYAFLLGGRDSMAYLKCLD